MGQGEGTPLLLRGLPVKKILLIGGNRNESECGKDAERDARTWQGLKTMPEEERKENGQPAMT